MSIFGRKKENPDEGGSAKEREPTEAELFRDRFRRFMTDEANFCVGGLPFAGFYVGKDGIPDVEAILREEGYREDDIDLESERTFQPEDETYLIVPVQGNPEMVMVRVGFKPEHILT